MELLLAGVAVLVIVVWWACFYLGVWIGHRLAMKAVVRWFGTADPDQLLTLLADRIRGYKKP